MAAQAQLLTLLGDLLQMILADRLHTLSRCRTLREMISCVQYAFKSFCGVIKPCALDAATFSTLNAGTPM